MKYSRGDLKADKEGRDGEVSTIQSVISHGLAREELRDEIYVQCVRQINNNPHQDQVDRYKAFSESNAFLFLHLIATWTASPVLEIPRNCINAELKTNSKQCFAIQDHF